MRLGILTDIHANREALAAVLADLAVRGVDGLCILGDIVGYGPDPEWCVERVRALGADGAIVLRGNHDAAVLAPDTGMSALARTAIDWTRGRLTAEQAGYLGGLPLSVRRDDVLLVHASANRPEEWSYVTAAHKAVGSFQASDARVILCGHVHVPLLVTCDRTMTVRDHALKIGLPVPLIRSRRWLAVVGSVGQPRDGVPQAAYAILDTGRNDLTFRRVAYDIAETVRKLRAAGLPDALAARLLKGE
jgi:diadenosine tetraphosphatase ApaH/serine/threonine PP2A family protein phosphatase